MSQELGPIFDRGPGALSRVRRRLGAEALLLRLGAAQIDSLPGQVELEQAASRHPHLSRRAAMLIRALPDMPEVRRVRVMGLIARLIKKINSPS